DGSEIADVNAGHDVFAGAGYAVSTGENSPVEAATGPIDSRRAQDRRTAIQIEPLRRETRRGARFGRVDRRLLVDATPRRSVDAGGGDVNDAMRGSERGGDLHVRPGIRRKRDQHQSTLGREPRCEVAGQNGNDADLRSETRELGGLLR